MHLHCKSIPAGWSALTTGDWTGRLDPMTRWPLAGGERSGGSSMAPVRVVEVENFRAVKNLRWLPGAGINCLIGPGDSGKSTILDAIDLCLGARRSLSLTEDDFHALDFGEWTLVSLRAQAQLGRSHAHRARQARRHRRHASDVATRLRANQTHRCQDQRVSSFAAQRHPFLASHAPPALTSFILVEGVAAAGDMGVPAGDAVQALDRCRLGHLYARLASVRRAC